VDLDKRPSIDLICVIDKSGSMSGEKMKQVKETLLYLLELLNENDRIMLV
jgi:Mg-chelatase subunit ChlD